MGERNKDLRSFSLGTNFISANTGRDGWGSVTLAITNATVIDLMNGGFLGVLLIYQESQFDELKEELKNELSRIK